MMKKILLLLLFCFSTLSVANLAVTTSGGVSLGSYKAGFLYYISEVVKRNSSLKNQYLTHFTGASAGAINSYLALDSLCNNIPTHYEDSLFWKTWIPTGIDKLFIKSKSGRQNIFTRDAFQESLFTLENNFKLGFPLGCKITLGIPVTHVKEYNMELTKDVLVPSLKDFFTFTITGRGKGIAPKVENLIFKKKVTRQLLLPFTKDSNYNFDLIKKVLFASSAFPVAFTPVTIPTCIKKHLQSNVACSSKNSSDLTFIDGGVFDNSPLNLSRDIAIELKGSLKEKKYYYAYINASNQDFPPQESEPKSSKDLDGIIKMSTNYLGSFVETARNGELARLIKQDPYIANRLHVAKAYFAPMGSPMYAFFGFYDKDFRKFDFISGMSDAKLLIQKLPTSLGLNYPEKENWTIFHCLNMAKSNNKDSAKYCLQNKDAVDKNLKILFQISLNRIYNHCRKVSIEKTRHHKACLKAAIKKTPQNFILPKSKDNHWVRKNTSSVSLETEEVYILRMLDLYNYNFKDLTKMYPNEDSVIDKIYKNQNEMLNTLKENQPDNEKQFVGIIKTTLLNRLQYIPPKSSTFFNIGNALEAGHSWSTKVLPRWLTFQSSLIVQDIHSYLGTEVDNIALIPNIGLSITGIRNQLPFRPILSLNYGYQFSLNDQFGQESCNEAHYNRSATTCSGQTLIPSLTLTMLDRFQVKWGVAIYNRKSRAKAPRSGFLMVGFQFY